MIANYIASKMAAHNQKHQIWGLSLARFDRVFFKNFQNNFLLELSNLLMKHVALLFSEPDVSRYFAIFENYPFRTGSNTHAFKRTSRFS